MDLLARREHALAELRNKLLVRFPESLDAISTVLARLQDEGLQSDERMAEAFLRPAAGGGQGPVKIRQALRQKGVDDVLIDAAMSAEASDWEALAIDAAVRKFGAKPADDQRERARRGRFLQQRGFSFDHINAALNHTFDDPTPV